LISGKILGYQLGKFFYKKSSAFLCCFSASLPTEVGKIEARLWPSARIPQIAIPRQTG